MRHPIALFAVLVASVNLACSSSESNSDATTHDPSPEPSPPPDPVPLLLVDQANDWMPAMPPVNAQHAAFDDLDGDGRPDVAQPTRDGLRILWNEGTEYETASDAAIPKADDVEYVRQAIVGDFDGDDVADLLLIDVLEEDERQLRLLSHAAARSFVAETIELDAGDDPRFGIAVDVDSDGDQDVVLTLIGDGSDTSAPRALLLINDGTGKLVDQTSSRLVAPGLTAYGVAAGDLDGDGNVDLLFSGDDVAHRLLINDGSGLFRDAAADALPAMDEPDGRIPALGDLDADGSLDILMPSATATQVLLNDGTGKFVDETPFVLGAQPGKGRNAVIADLDLDTFADVVIGGTASPLRVLRNDGTGRLFDYSSSLVPWGPGDADVVSIGVSDADEDGDLDLFVSRTSLTRPWLLINWHPNETKDTDGDGVPDSLDNCPSEPNADQANQDAMHFSCASKTDCKARTGCQLALVGGERAYLLCEGPKTWEQARAFCQSRGADLIVIDDEQENEFITGSGLPTAWIGLSDRDEEGTFAWVDGTTPETTYWNTDEPNDSGGTEDCGGIFTEGETAGMWNDFDCSSERAFVCEDEVDRSPRDPGDACDVCPGIHDPGQKDTDNDGIGDACAPEET